MINLSWEDVEDRIRVNILHQMSTYNFAYIYGIPRGGIYPAIMLRDMALAMGYKCRLIETLEGYSPSNILIIDDVIETGKTMENYPLYFRVAVWNKLEEPTSKWIVFPWERMCKENPGYSRDKENNNVLPNS